MEWRAPGNNIYVGIHRTVLDAKDPLVEAAVPFALVFTKAEKTRASALGKNVTLFLDAMKDWSEGEPAVFTSSAKTGEGRREILAFIEAAMQG